MRQRRRRRIEDATVLDVGKLRSLGWLAQGVREGAWRFEGRARAIGSLRAAIDGEHGELHMSFAGSSHVVGLECSAPPFGGRRWWLVCPISGKHASRLYFFPDQKEFRHREAVDPPLSYPIQRTSGLNRALFLRNALASKVHDPSTLSGKPRLMRWKTYLRLVAKERRLDDEVTAMVMARISPRARR